MKRLAWAFCAATAIVAGVAALLLSCAPAIDAPAVCVSHTEDGRTRVRVVRADWSAQR